jgi:hypothetical protein
MITPFDAQIFQFYLIGRVRFNLYKKGGIYGQVKAKPFRVEKYSFPPQRPFSATNAI